MESRRVQQLSSHLTAAASAAPAPAPAPVVYIANRGIIALRVARTCKQEGFTVVGAYCQSDSQELFVRQFSKSKLLSEKEDGPSAYMNIANVIQCCRELGAQFVHPGIGLLSESAEFAQACQEAGLVFIGPTPEQLALFGSKLATCALAKELGIPTLSLGVLERGQSIPKFPALLKASNGGGGIGLRIVEHAGEVEEMFDRCLSEAKRAFGGEPAILCEIYLRECRHVEVQIVGDGLGHCFSLSDRECSIQRKFQKVIEIAPCPELPQALRDALHETAKKLAGHVQYRGVGTFEFLVKSDGDAEFYFIECNPRLQVEHTVTEEIFAPTLDLVKVQLDVARRVVALSERDFVQRSNCFALQCRVCAEKYSVERGIEPVDADAVVRALDFPRGTGVRVESICRSGRYKPNFRFDSLLAQIIVTGRGTFKQACARVLAALEEARVVGCATNLALLKAILANERFQTGLVSTRFLDGELMPSPQFQRRVLELEEADREPEHEETTSGARRVKREPFTFDANTGALIVSSPMTCSVVQVLVKPGDIVLANKTVLFVLSALKMEHEVKSPRGGQVLSVSVRVNDQANEGAELLQLAPDNVSAGGAAELTQEDELQGERSQAFLEFQDLVKYNTLDESRLDKTGKRLADPTRLTARQIIREMFDPNRDTLELGRLASNGYQKHSVGDGLYVIKGWVNEVALQVARPKALVLAYDYTVLAGTQGLVGHRKKDRAFALALRERHPVVYFAEGGGGRAGDAKKGGFTSTGLDGPAFTLFAKLAVAKVPLIGAVSGFCFAGNAALLGTCDLIIATENVSLGMGGPAMIEGGGLGQVRAEDVGPVRTHYELGVVDVLAKTDAEMVRLAKQALGYFQGQAQKWRARNEAENIAAKRVLRNLVPSSNRRLAFNMRDVLANVMDLDSLLEIKSGYATNLITCLGRLEGRPVGILANNCKHLSGTLDAHASAKASKFLKLCSQHQLPVVSFCDTPGFLVGVESERQGLVKLAGELFIAGAALEVPLVTVVVRRCVGLGGQAMCGGDVKQPQLTVAWPTAEFAAMGLEGAVRLGFREELKQNPELFDSLLQVAQEGGRAVSVADHFEIDDVIDPADTRQVIINALAFALSE